MGLLAVGSVALDSIKTPSGEVKEALGGSATYFAASASLFTEVKMVGVVGEDFPQEHLDFLRAKNIDLEGLEIKKGRTFRWSGEYSSGLKDVQSRSTELNVLGNFKANIPDSYRETEHIFLANIDPDQQKRVCEQIKKPKFIACDSMNYWIENKKKMLEEIFGRVNLVILNDSEVREFTRENNLLKAVKSLSQLGMDAIIIKKGEGGSLLFTEDSFFVAPAYPVESVLDPTGAGDSFAGGVMGYLSRVDKFNTSDIKKAMVYGSIIASFTIEAFGLKRLKDITREDVEARLKKFDKMRA